MARSPFLPLAAAAVLGGTAVVAFAPTSSSSHLRAYAPSLSVSSPLDGGARQRRRQHPLPRLGVAAGETTTGVADEEAAHTANGSDSSDLVSDARDRAAATASRLSSSSLFLTRPSDIRELRKAVGELESVAAPPSTMGDAERESMVGDWTLVATANFPAEDIRRRLEERSDKMKKGGENNNNNNNNKKKLFPFGMMNKNGKDDDNPIRESLRKSFSVTQRIRTYDAPPFAINRVDNIIEFSPPSTLESIVPADSPLSFLRTIDVNPLGVKTAKLALVHKAEVESVRPVLRTRIAQVSTVLNVAGTETGMANLDPNGADIFGVNVPLGEFWQVGTFDTTYVDDDFRVSRSRNNPLTEQLRVFVKKGSTLLDDGGSIVASEEKKVEDELEWNPEPQIEEELNRAADAVAERVVDEDAAKTDIESPSDAAVAAVLEVFDAASNNEAPGNIYDVPAVKEEVGGADEDNTELDAITAEISATATTEEMAETKDDGGDATADASTAEEEGARGETGVDGNNASDAEGEGAGEDDGENASAAAESSGSTEEESAVAAEVEVEEEDEDAAKKDAAKKDSDDES